jgi:SnoaL-like domain
VAEMLDSSVESVTSALKRARASLPRRPSPSAEHGPAPTVDSPAEQALVAEFVRAYESADLAAVVALLTDDVFMSMPPMPLEYQGRDVVARFCAAILRPGRRFDLAPIRANGQPAFGTYLRAPTGIRHGTGLFVLTLTGDRICALTRFENSVFPWFGLPLSLPSEVGIGERGTRVRSPLGRLEGEGGGDPGGVGSGVDAGGGVGAGGDDGVLGEQFDVTGG